MMPHSIKTAVPNGVLFIADGGGGLAPDPIRGVPIQATRSCIAAGCLIDSEGETAITVESQPRGRSRLFSIVRW